MDYSQIIMTFTSTDRGIKIKDQGRGGVQRSAPARGAPQCARRRGPRARLHREKFGGPMGDPGHGRLRPT
eukprot:scaffold291059_cov32-Tisochrysis_lutea.AAC.2